MRDRAKNRTDPARHAEMLISVSVENPSEETLRKIAAGRIVEHEGKHYAPGGASDSLVSTDPRVIAAFLQAQCLTMGFTTQFAINPRTREIVKLFKKGKVAQRDVRELARAGFSEWSFSWTWSPEYFRFPDGRIERVSGEIDLTPTKTLREAIRWGKAMGRIS